MTASIEVRRYTPSHAEEWDRFVQDSKNGTFLFNRSFMEYHRERFSDHSLLLFIDGGLQALLPANAAGDVLVSHGGLTYGGFITNTKMQAGVMLDVVEATLDHARMAGFTAVHYKPIPHFYHRVPAEEDIYALFRAGARVTRVDVASAIRMADRLPMSKSKRHGIKAARKAGIEVRESADWAACWEILAAALTDRHNSRPTHSLAEIKALSARFPRYIRLFGAYQDQSMISALVIFDCGPTVHVQYIGSSSAGRDLHGVDLIVEYLLDSVYKDAVWFDFGISTEDGGTILNTGLARQKEMFGARSVVYKHMEIPL